MSDGWERGTHWDRDRACLPVQHESHLFLLVMSSTLNPPHRLVPTMVSFPQEELGQLFKLSPNFNLTIPKKLIHTLNPAHAEHWDLGIFHSLSLFALD